MYPKINLTRPKIDTSTLRINFNELQKEWKMKNNIIKVDFYDNEIQAYRDNDGNVFVAMKPICEQLGIDWEKQRIKINKDFGDSTNTRGIFSDTLQKNIIFRTYRTGGAVNKHLMLNYKKLNMWLCKISVRHVKEEVRPLLQKYQEECAEVLYKYFHEGIAINERFIKDHAELKREVEEIKNKIKPQRITDKGFIQDILDKIDSVVFVHYNDKIKEDFNGIKGFIYKSKSISVKQADYVNNVYEAIWQEIDEFCNRRTQRLHNV